MAIINVTGDDLFGKKDAASGEGEAPVEDATLSREIPFLVKQIEATMQEIERAVQLLKHALDLERVRVMLFTHFTLFLSSVLLGLTFLTCFLCTYLLLCTVSTVTSVHFQRNGAVFFSAPEPRSLHRQHQSLKASRAPRGQSAGG